MARLTKKPRIMICGDSMTQGSEGDWTWRYRLWQWLKDQNCEVAFVGPYLGTHEPDIASEPRPPPLYHHDRSDPIKHHGGYAHGVDEKFDSHHFSVWGRQCKQAKDLIEEELRNHPADLLLIMLGFNDIGWFVSDAKGTLQSMAMLVASARKANSDLKLAIANIPQRTPMAGREDLPIKTCEYNKLLARAIPDWTSSRSPVHLVKLCDEYDAEMGSHDGLHPNALGDYQIAKAFSMALVDHFGLGSKALSIPDHIPQRQLSIPSGFKMISSPTGVTATWNKVYGSLHYEFRHRSGEDDFSTIGLGSNRWDSHWISEGTKYEAQVRACYSQQKSDFTPLLSATTRPSLAPPPTDIKIKSADRGIAVTWKAPEGDFTGDIVQYNVLWNDTDDPDTFLGLAAFEKSPGHIDELKHGHTIDLCMLTWTSEGEGLPGPMQRFVVGS